MPPVGAAPSTPELGELVASTFSLGTYWADLYADGRLIWSRPAYGVGWVERRLTPEGVDLVRTEILSTGLFEPDKPPDRAEPNDVSLGEIGVRTEGQLVNVWGSQTGIEPWFGKFDRLHDRLRNLQSWLPPRSVGRPSRQAIRALQICDLDV